MRSPRTFAWDHIAFTDELRALAQRTDAICFGSLAQRHEASRTAILSFLKAMPEGSLRIFDINLRLQYYTRETIHTSLEHADILKLNDEEVPIVARLLGLEGDMEAICRQVLTDYSLRAVILTRGADGCSIYHEKGSVFHPSACIKVADTVGAGDSFTAGFVSALLAGRSHLEAVALATRVAAFVCSHHGAMPTLPSEYSRSRGIGIKADLAISPEIARSFDLSLKRFTIYKSQLLLKPYHSHSAKVDQPQRGHNTHL